MKYEKKTYSKARNTPFHLLILNVLMLKGRIKKDMTSIQTISFERTEVLNSTSFTIGIKPRIHSMLNIFDPIKFPIEISVSFLKAAIEEVANSGTLVPNAIIVAPITLSETSKYFAISTAPSNIQSEPKANAIHPSTVNSI